MWSLVSLIPLIVSLFANKDKNGSTTQTTTDPTLQAMLPQMQQMFATQARRQESANPLYDAVLRMTMGGLPKWARNGSNVTAGLGGSQFLAPGPGDPTYLPPDPGNSNVGFPRLPLPPDDGGAHPTSTYGRM